MYHLAFLVCWTDFTDIGSYFFHRRTQNRTESRAVASV